jgi:hypothetical protein
MRYFFYILVIILSLNSIQGLASTPQAIAISDPLITKIRQYGDSIWAVGRGISVVNLKTKELHKVHQDYMYLASSELIFKDIYKDNDNKYYFASNSGLWVVKDTIWEILQITNSPLPSDSINCIVPDKNGTLWIGTEKGLIRKNADNWELENFGIDFPVRSITFDSQSDTIYICSDTYYFHVLVGSELTPISFPVVPLMETRQVQYRKVIKDDYGIKWIATFGTYGLVRWDGEDVKQLLMNNTAESIIFDIESDKEVNIVGINGEGYFKVDASYSDISQLDYDLSNGALGRAMTAMRASDGHVWFGGTCPLTNRIAIKNPTKYIRYNNALMPGPFLNTFFAAENGNTYLANYNGFGIFDTSTFQFFDSTSHGSKITGITDISSNLENEVFLVAYNQLFRFDKDSLIDVLGSKFKSYSYYGSTFDNSDTLWLTSRRFIWKYFDGKVDSIVIPGPSDNYCFTDINIDKNQTKWIKTLKGYYGYRGGIWSDSIMPADIPAKIRTFEDLKMYIDYNGDIWLSSIDVLFKYDGGAWEMLTSGKDGVPEFASLINKVPVINFNPEGKMYLNIDEKVYTKEGGLWKEPKELNPIFAKTYKLFVDVNDNKWIYKTEVDSVAITMFREIGVYNSIKENSAQNEEQYLISPNPASDYINIDMRNYTLKGVVEDELSFLRMQESICIIDVLGNCVLTLETGLRPVSTRIDISSLSAGVYFIHIGNEKPGKFVKL